MAKVMIVFELAGTERQTEKLDESLKKLGNPCHVMSNLRVVDTDIKADQILVALKNAFFQPQDRFLVVPITQSWQAHNCKAYGQCYED
jgi:hypothetical protein